MTGCRQFTDALDAAEVDPNGVLMVHSSFRQLGKEGYSPEDILEALKRYMADGTLLLPTMSWRYVKPDKPEFDEIATPSNTGVLTEIFRTQYATKRSIHPTHSVAGLGKRLDEILGGHHLCVTPCAAESPFRRMLESDATILMLGIGMDCCTVLHAAEEATAPDVYVKPESLTEKYVCTDRDGEKVDVMLRRHKFLPRDYWQCQDLLHANGALSIFRLGNTIARVFRASTLFDLAVERLSANKDWLIAKSGQRYRLM